MKSFVLSLILSMTASMALAATEVRPGVVDVAYHDDSFSYILIQGEAADLLYAKMQTKERPREAINSRGEYISKNSLDSRMTCELYKRTGRAECKIMINSATGDIKQFWKH